MSKKTIIFIPLTLLILYLSVFAEENISRLIILHTNDLHGHITPRKATWMNPAFPPEVGGHASMRRYINQVREEAQKNGDHVLLLDAGDIFQGTPVGSHDKGETVVKFMNEMGYDAMTLGNHDYDEGEEYAKLISKNTDFPVLAANIVNENGEVVDYVEPYIIKDIDGIKVGILGLTTMDTKTLTPEEATAGLTFIKVDEAARKYVKILREEEKVDVLIGLFHLGVSWKMYDHQRNVEEAVLETGNFSKDFGLNAVELAGLVPGIDLMIGGHIHYGLRKPYEHPVTHTIIVQTYALGSGVGHIELLVDKDSHKMIGYEYDPDGEEVTLQREEIWPLPDVDEEIQKAVDIAEKGLDEVIGESLVDLLRGDYENLMGNVITDAMRFISDADVALINRGGMRANMYSGEIAIRDAKNVLPFYDLVVTFDVSGTTLREILEASVSGRRRDTNLSGVNIVFDFARPSGDRLLDVKVNGEPLEDDKRYIFATSSYLAEGSIGYDILADLEGRYTEYSLSEALIEYIKANSPIKPKLEGRIKKVVGETENSSK